MTHGSDGVVYGTDNVPVRIGDEIIDVIGSCKSLKNKPKLIFFQACRGM